MAHSPNAQNYYRSSNDGARLACSSRKKQREMTKYGSRRKTLVVDLTTLVVLLSWMYFSSIFLPLFWLGFGYLCIGFLVIRKLGVPKSDALQSLSFLDRFWLRIFHALFWPWYVKKSTRSE